MSIAIFCTAVIVVVIACVGIKVANFVAIPFWQVAVVIGWQFGCMLINDLVKMIFLKVQYRLRNGVSGRLYTFQNSPSVNANV